MAVTAAARSISVLLVAVLALAACDTSGRSSAGGAASPAAARPTAASPTAAAPAAPGCRHRYEKWRHGGATAAFNADLKYIASKRHAANFSHRTSVLKKIGSAVVSLPLPPECADPAAYYSQVLARIKTISDHARSASGLGGLLMAEAPLVSVTKIEGKLSTELSRTVGSSF